MSGQIPHRDHETGEKFFYKPNKAFTKTRKLLPDRYMALFQNKQIVCIEYSDLTDDQEREVFQRVQLGMALTVAERLQAISGPWPSLVREISEEYFEGPSGIGELLDLDRTRARDFHNLAMSIFSISHLPSLVQGTQAQMEKLLARTDGPSEGTRKKVHESFTIFKYLAKDKQLRGPLRKPIRVAPAEFIIITTLIAMFKDKLSLPQLSEAIKILRTQTRSEHVDVRTNSKVYKTMFNVLQKQINAKNLAPTPGKPVAGELAVLHMSSVPETKTSSDSGKRKRVISSDDDSDNREEIDKSKPKAKFQATSNKILKIPGNSTGAVKGLAMSPPVSLTSIKHKDLKTALPSPTSVNGHQISNSTNGLLSQSRFSKIQAAKAQAAKLMQRLETETRSQLFTAPASPISQTSMPPSNFSQKTAEPMHASKSFERALMFTEPQGSLPSLSSHSYPAPTHVHSPPTHGHSPTHTLPQLTHAHPPPTHAHPPPTHVHPPPIHAPLPFTQAPPPPVHAPPPLPYPTPPPLSSIPNQQHNHNQQHDLNRQYPNNLPYPPGIRIPLESAGQQSDNSFSTSSRGDRSDSGYRDTRSYDDRAYDNRRDNDRSRDRSYDERDKDDRDGSRKYYSNRKDYRSRSRERSRRDARDYSRSSSFDHR